jgi:hypothetical protein
LTKYKRIFKATTNSSAVLILLLHQNSLQVLPKKNEQKKMIRSIHLRIKPINKNNIIKIILNKI